MWPATDLRVADDEVLQLGLAHEEGVLGPSLAERAVVHGVDEHLVDERHLGLRRRQLEQRLLRHPLTAHLVHCRTPGGARWALGTG